MTLEDATAAWLADAWSQAPTKFEIEVEGCTIACLGWNHDATDLPGLVLVHGFRAHGHWWDHIAPSLTDRYRVTAITLSGMGDSGWRPVYSRAFHAREILAVAQATGSRTIVAHSYGSIASLIAAGIGGTEAFDRLVVIDSGIPLDTDAAARIPEIPSRTYPDRDSTVARFRLNPPGQWPIASVVRHIGEHSVRRTADGDWTWKFDPEAATSLNEEVYRSTMYGITVPCDVIHGAMTEIMSPDRIAEVRKMAPDCGVPIAIPSAHHHIMAEQPQALVVAIRALLANPR